jgi:hypothetical protein
MAGYDNAFAASSTLYVGQSGVAYPNSSRQSHMTVIPRSGTVSALCVFGYIDGTIGSSESVTITLRDNQTASPLTVSQSWNVANFGPTCDTTHTQAVSAGDLIDLKLVTPAWVTQPTNVNLGWAVDIQ